MQALKQNVVVRAGAVPPSSSSTEVQYRDGVLALCLPNTRAGRKRRAVLEANLRGNIQEKRVELFWEGHRNDVPSDADVQKWAQATARALMPNAHKVFARSRWVTSLDTIADQALLASVHSLLQQAIPVWLGKLGFAAAKPDQQPVGLGVVPVPEGQEKQPEPGSSSYWAEMNAEAQRHAAAFAAGNPALHLLLLRV